MKRGDEGGGFPHLLTVDVEESFRGVDGEDRPGPSDLAAAMEEMLDLLAEEEASATFFFLGDDVKGLESLLRRCADEGHGIGCHGMRHRRVDMLTPEEFRRDLSRALAVIGDAAGAPCLGYRAPWFSVSPDMKWFFEILAEEGLRYDASLRLPAESPAPAAAGESEIREVAVPCLSVAGLSLGLLGGLALRLLPLTALSRLITRCERGEPARPACIYLHPYEWRGPPASGLPLSRPALRRHLLVGRTLPKLRGLMKRHSLISVERWLELNP